jgi:sugar-specific transcriptional regulator TrmB
MKETFTSELQALGLSSAEAQIYTTLLSNGSLGATAIANLTGLQRSNVYPILWSLADKGVVERGAGYGSRFTALPPGEALPSLIVREREDLVLRERLASQLAGRMASVVNSNGTAPEQLIEVIRHPKVIAERFDRLQLVAKRQIDSLIKAPFFCRPSNPAQQKAQKHGVRVRSLYERAVLNDAAVEPYLAKWVGAGEEARVYDGQLPHKLAIFDSQVVLMPLMLAREQTRALLIRHPQLARNLTLAFEFLWQQSEPISPTLRKKSVTLAKSAHRNGKRLIDSNSNH